MQGEYPLHAADRSRVLQPAVIGSGIVNNQAHIGRIVSTASPIVKIPQPSV
jgi:hypothetical protein